MKVYKRNTNFRGGPEDVIETNFFIILETSDGTRFDIRENKDGGPAITISIDGQLSIKPDAANMVTVGIVDRIPFVRADVRLDFKKTDSK